VALASSLAGCTHYVTSHQPFTPLLDHAGQLDVGVRAGFHAPSAASVGAHVAYAPIDHLEVLAAFDYVGAGPGDPDPWHVGGAAAVGTFVRHDVFRLEALAGSGFGYAEGTSQASCAGTGPTMPCPDGDFALSGGYATPMVQVLVGFEVPYFELAAGMRLDAFVAGVSIVRTRGTAPPASAHSTYTRLFVEPILTIRVPIEMVRIEITGGYPFSVAGDTEPDPRLSPEAPMPYYVVGGFAVQLDTEPRPELDDPEIVTEGTSP
jgi:hypothetical protein